MTKQQLNMWLQFNRKKIEPMETKAAHDVREN